MTPNQRPPLSLHVSLAAIITLTLAATTAAAAPLAKKGKAAAAKPAARASAKSSAKSSPKASAKTAKTAKAERNARGAKGRQPAAADKPSRRETRAERRQREREERASAGGRKVSKRERLAQARREAEERRRRAEAARRAELARLAAIARQRAIDEGLRNEVQANILRDDVTGEDPEVRRVAVQALGNHAGSVVVMNPKTGQIYTIVNQEWGVRRGFKPCSTIKLVSGLAGLAEGVINPVQENVSYSYTSRASLTGALATSDNGYFQRVGRQVGFDRMSSYARQLGLGERTGVNHVGEFPGRWPLFKNDVGMLRMSSHGDDIEVTPVQLAALASVFATGGTLVTPHLPRTPEENVKFKTEVRRQLNIPQETLRRMLPGMVGAVTFGTARKTYDATQTIAGKTGTCIGAGGVWVGLFTSYAPVEDPQLAVAVITRGSDARKNLPVAVAGHIYRTLNYRFGSRNGRQPYQFVIPPTVVPQRPVDALVADAEETDEADEEEKAQGGGTVVTSEPTNNNGVRPVLMSVPSQTRPAASPSATPAARSAQPAPAAQPQTRAGNGDDRPRRVQTDKPQQ